MPKEIDAIYNPTEQWKPIEEGEYPAHVTSLSTREVNTKAGPAIVKMECILFMEIVLI